MNTAPTLFAVSPAAETATPLDSNPGSLVDLLYDGFYLLTLLHSQRVPTGADSFADRIQKFLDAFDHSARKHHFSAEDIFDAKYALCAAIDETILSTANPIRGEWERRPLQLTLFGDQLAGEHFFDKLDNARNSGAARINALEVFHMCLLLGFKGKYLLEGPEKLKYRTAQLGDQIAHIKGKQPSFAPHAIAPDHIRNALSRGLPLWVLGAVTSLLGLIAFVGFKVMGENETHRRLEPYEQIVEMAPRAPTLTITLP